MFAKRPLLPFIFSFLVVVIFLVDVQAQLPNGDNPNLLNKPKDIVYDSVRKLSYISNYGGNCIVKMDSLGNQEYMLQGINSPMGLHLCSDTLIISSNTPSKITALNVIDNSVIYELEVPLAQHLAMMDIDSRSGIIYIVEQLGAIFKLNYRTLCCSIFVPPGAGIHYGSQTLEVDTANNRLLVFKWDGGYIRSVDINDSSQISNASHQLISQIQASQKGAEGEIYVSSYINNGIYEYSSDLSEVTEIMSGLQKPSGIAYNPDDNSLLVCNYEGNSISEIPLTPLHVEEPAAEVIRCLVYPNPASERCHIQLTMNRSFKGLVRIINSGGSVIQQNSVDFFIGTRSYEVDTKPLSPGIYLVQVVESGKVIATSRLVAIR